MQSLKSKTEQLPKKSKQWWTLNKRFLDRQASPALSPLFKNAQGVWCRTPKSKADAFAKCWEAKCELPPELFEHFFCQVVEGMSSWFAIRVRDVRKVLDKSREDQATGPEGISANFFKRLARAVDLSIAILTRRIFAEGQVFFYESAFSLKVMQPQVSNAWPTLVGEDYHRGRA